MDPITLGLGAVSLGAGLFGKKRKLPQIQTPDISGELAKLDELYAQQGNLLRQTTMADIANAKKGAVSGLAARGIYSSPVSQKTMNEVEKQGLLALATGQAGLLGQQATARTSALNNLLNYTQSAQRANAELAMQKYGEQAVGRQGLLALGSGLLMDGLSSKTPSWARRNNVTTQQALNAYGAFRNPSLNLGYGVI